MKRFDYQKMLEYLTLILKCPVCSGKYRAEKTNILEPDSTEYTDDPSILVHTECEACNSSVVFNISLEGTEMLSVGNLTDLTAEDMERFKDAEPITSDEVIELHKQLKKLKGNISQPLKK